MECVKLNAYLELDYRFSYISTKAGAEIDLLIERPGLPTVLMEIKSTAQSLPEYERHLKSFYADFAEPVGLVVSQDPVRKRNGWIRHMHWAEALAELFPC